MWPKVMCVAIVFLFYTGYSYARKGNREIFGKCKERQNFAYCGDFGTMADSGLLYSFNQLTGKCEVVFGMCSTATYNLFKAKRKCKQVCGKERKGCNIRGKWYKHKAWIKSEGCCMCLNGLMSCSACTESNGFCSYCSRFNRPEAEQIVTTCRYGEECDDYDDDDCRCKSKEEYCEAECQQCEEGGDDDCPDECDCELFQQLGLGPVIY